MAITRRGESTRLHQIKCQVFPFCHGLGSDGGVGQLCFLKSNVNAEVYQQVLEYFMLPAGEIFGCTNFTFQQDLAPAHSARSKMRWLEDHGIEVLPWPANSPDLNPIENLWGLVKKANVEGATKHPRGTQRCHSKSVELSHPDDCYHLVLSIPQHIQAVIAAKGAATKY